MREFRNKTVKAEHLVDKFNRKIGSVRISITDRCNLRCKYCMPEEGIEWQKKEHILTFEEIIYLIRIFHSYGIKNYRLTGGEPTVRDDVVKLVELIKSEFPDINLSMTTNGINLTKFAVPFKEAGLDRLNISLDTLNHEKFYEMTRRDQFTKVMDGISAAINANFENIKINSVALRDFNNDYASLKEFIDFSEENNVEIRFIEFMPFTGTNWRNGQYIDSNSMIEEIKAHEEITELPLLDPSQTSRIWSLREGKSKIGFISSVSNSFCDSCNRIRITAEGNLRPCLHNSKEYPLRDLIRKNVPKEEIMAIIQKGLNEKWKAHPDFLAPNFILPIDDREMIRIGG